MCHNLRYHYRSPCHLWLLHIAKEILRSDQKMNVPNLYQPCKTQEQLLDQKTNISLLQIWHHSVASWNCLEPINLEYKQSKIISEAANLWMLVHRLGIRWCIYLQSELIASGMLIQFSIGCILPMNYTLIKSLACTLFGDLIPYFAIDMFTMLSTTFYYNPPPLHAFQFAFHTLSIWTSSYIQFSQSQCALSIITFISKILEQ